MDNSGNGYDGVIAGDLVVNQESYVLGSSDYVEVEVPTNVDTSNFLSNLNASLDIKLDSNQENKTILEAIGKAIPDEVPPYTGRYTSQVVNGYEVELHQEIGRAHV